VREKELRTERKKNCEKEEEERKRVQKKKGEEPKEVGDK
jgi:hypothetical protein